MLNRRDVLKLSAASAACAACGGIAVSADERPAPVKTLNDRFDFTPPTDAKVWAARRQALREQVQVACGLWPMPAKPNLDAVVRGKVERDGYTVEKVHFTSLPGHLVTGNLYRPAKAKGKSPAVLFAHGHWDNGRLHDAGEGGAKGMVARGEERDIPRARLFMQALPITFARLGFVVFQYDMVGYAESTAIPHILSSGVPHPEGFADVQGELHLQSLLGLQTWNSVRALDFVTSLPDVDAARVGVTGASGGGTQTFLLAAIDDRVACAAPAVMVSTGMQGGCVCENASLLRIGTGNVELAALFAPKPLALTGANDWTKEIMTRGFPELQAVYKLLGKPENVAAKAWPQFPHNYNRPAREFVYSWFRKHLQGVDGDVTEPAFAPLPPAQLRVFDAEHPRPAGELRARELRGQMTRDSDAQLKAMPEKGRREVLGAALAAMVATGGPAGRVEVLAERERPQFDNVPAGAAKCRDGRLRRAGAEVPFTFAAPKSPGPEMVVWFSPYYLFGPAFGASETFARGFSVIDGYSRRDGRLRPDPHEANPIYAGFTFGYNRSYLAERVANALALMAYLRDHAKASAIHFVGFNDHGPVALLAAALAQRESPKLVGKVVADLGSLGEPTTTADPRFIPGLAKYGGFAAFTQLLEPKRLFAYGTKERPETPTLGQVAEWLAK